MQTVFTKTESDYKIAPLFLRVW